MQKVSFNTLRKSKYALPLLGLLILVIVVATIYASISLNQDSSNKNQDPSSQNGQFITSKTIIYGTWTEKTSDIYMYDLTNSTEYLIAQLPSNIKDVSFIPPNKLIFISNTNVQDHGTEISQYNLDTKQTTSLIQADNGYGIDDYVISQNNQFIATWEVQINTETGTLLNGNSKVKTIDLTNPSIKNTIYEEIATRDNPVRYPLSITSKGDVIMDRFIPNASRGWSNGMSISDFSGSQKEDLSVMQPGTYGTQPTLSQDETKLLFSGYDGSQGPGQDQYEGFRRAMIVTNTIEELDINSKTRRKYPQFDNSNLYLSPKWNGENIVVSVGKKGNLDFGTYQTQFESTEPTTLPLTDASTADIVTFLTPTTLLTGKQFQSQTAIGNLGENYSAIYDELSVQSTDGSNHKLSLSNNLVQYITTLDGSVKNMGFSQKNIEPIHISAEQQQLRLQTFVIKPTLPPVRKKLQSNPPKKPTPTPTPQPDKPTPTKSTGLKPAEPKQRDPVELDCQHNSNPCSLVACDVPATAKCGKLDFSAPDWQEVKKCHAEFEREEIAAGNCWDSPLYLYGEKGTNVNVKINTPIYNSNIPYSDSFDLTLLENGMFSSGNHVSSSISYDYQPAIRKITPPKKGIVTSRKNLSSALKYYAFSLSLNQKETEDLLTEAHRKTSSPYIFVSFFDHKTSSAILPIQFSPNPDTYRNIVFYLKEFDTMPNLTTSMPEFEPIRRTGFTAVEISTLVE